SGSSNSGGSNSGNSGSSQSQSPVHNLNQYVQATQNLVRQYAEQKGITATAAFQEIIGTDSLTNSRGVIDHGALLREVQRAGGGSTSGGQQAGGSQQQGGQQSGGSQQQGDSTAAGDSGTAASPGSGAGQVAANWATQRATNPAARYVWGSSGPTNFDCSGLTQQAFAQAGISIPRNSNAQLQGGQSVPIGSVQAGDLVFWTDASGRAYHVAIYIGNGQIAHARNPSTGLGIDSLNWSSASIHPVAKRYH
ncbi:MAG: C40 family peptidase, partial [Nesterenkonia sp.]|nr:C40 family peptidase [Nesterenkonia sp.]